LTVSPGAAGVFGANNSPQGVGVQGNGPEAGVSGFSDRGTGVRAFSNAEVGLLGQTGAHDHPAIFGSNTSPNASSGGGAGAAGVFGLTVSPGAAGVFGANNSPQGVGVHGNGPEAGVSGSSDRGTGVRGLSNDGIGVFGRGGGLAGKFEGDVEVTGDVRLTGADLAEDFELVGTFAEPGTVMVLDGDDRIKVSAMAYDRRVAGVVSGAGGYRPGLVLDHRGRAGSRHPLALAGKAYCKVDAGFGPVETGDLLTTSPTPGHAMKAADAAQAFGSVLGKAMASLASGTGLLPILVSLQ
jgi:hypothetical protein